MIINMKPLPGRAVISLPGQKRFKQLDSVEQISTTKRIIHITHMLMILLIVDRVKVVW